MDCPKAWGRRLRWSSHSLLAALLLLTISGVVVHGAYDSCSASTPFTERTSTATLVPDVVKLNAVPAKGSIAAPVLVETDTPEWKLPSSRKSRSAGDCSINGGTLKNVTTGVLLRASGRTKSKPIKGVVFSESGGYRPPDQALCVGKHYIVEGGNVVWAIYNKGGKRLLTFNRQSFFGLPSNGDPVCFFDAGLETFFLATITSLDTISVATFKDGCTLSAPVHVYTIQYDSFPDYPQIGSDKYGFWVATNQYDYSPFVSTFLGVDVVGIDKCAMAKGLPAFQYHISKAKYDEDFVHDIDFFTLHPQRLQPGSYADCSYNGVMYFMASNMVPFVQSEIVIAAVTNTKNLVKGMKPSGLYALPLPAGTVTDSFLPGINQPDGNVITNFDTRMQSAAYASGKLYGTSMSVGAGSGISISYYVVKPRFCKGALTAKVLYSDTIGDDCGNDMVFPSIGVSPSGNAIIAFSYTGRTAFPSVGYVPLTASGIVGPNFYLVVNGTDNSVVGRWGDYSAAQYDSCAKQVYFATLTAKDIWATWISSATPPCAPYTNYLPPPLSTYPPCPATAGP